ncbi:unnamed protein product [Strongylus vulgaris]|uniref:Uncharacterized protein n=1 Tax=Strongylus vulgaris TaxID=40348 RepID=A0A3P7ISK8_STRVU|nr:unnamed protein product [Strongylus vulgaris]
MRSVICGLLVCKDITEERCNFQLDPKGIASIYFCIGDALLDLDGTPIPFNDIEFVRGYTQKFNKNNRFTVVIERPLGTQALFMYNMLFKLMLPQESDVEMGPDAVLIGKEAANMHRMVFRRLKPRSVYGPRGTLRYFQKCSNCAIIQKVHGTFANKCAPSALQIFLL